MPSGGPLKDEQPIEQAVVSVLVASPAELPVMQQTGAILEKLGLPYETRVMSSSRSPDEVDEYARTAFERGIKVLIATTGISGHLAAAVAARTILPVIGVPISSDQMTGTMALSVTALMPSGVPVATVGIDAAVNAAVLAAQIVALTDPDVQKQLWKFKDDLAEGLRL
jgi:5-(carboxyamino)imidazole ribonucleotide mutase